MGKLAVTECRVRAYSAWCCLYPNGQEHNAAGELPPHMRLRPQAIDELIDALLGVRLRMRESEVHGGSKQQQQAAAAAAAHAVILITRTRTARTTSRSTSARL